MAHIAGGAKWWNTVCGGLSLAQRMPRLRTCWIRYIHLELRFSREISRDGIHGHDSTAAKLRNHGRGRLPRPSKIGRTLNPSVRFAHRLRNHRPAEEEEGTNSWGLLARVGTVAGAVISTESGCVQTGFPSSSSRRFMVTFRWWGSTSTSR